MSVFISYCSKDEPYAVQLERVLTLNGIPAWFAPKSIGDGEDFSLCIGKELSPHTAKDEDDRIDEDLMHLKRTQVFLLLLSAHSMRSKWVKKELTAAINSNVKILVLQLDHAPIEESFRFKLQDIQITDAYRLPPDVLKKLVDDLKKFLGRGSGTEGMSKQRERLTYEQIGIYPIVEGDPYFVEGETMQVTLGKGRFFLAPPTDLTEDPDNREYCRWHHFEAKDEVFDSTLDETCAALFIPGLREMIEASRRKIFLQFLNQENGCYFNNRKYGISRISGFERTENMAERPILRVEMFVTDYFTHRVMKDVCKQLAKDDAYFFRKIDYKRIGPARILLTSLGINLILAQGGEQILLTSRSTNAAETYDRVSYSLSVIEGVSLSDYDTYKQSVNMKLAVLRGLQEELGVDEHLLKIDTLKYYDLFINPQNLEMGLACSVELKPNIQLERDVLCLHGKDEQLEVSGKRIVSVQRLEEFVYNNMDSIMPSCAFTICVYLESMGVFLLDRVRKSLLRDRASVVPKSGKKEPCGDTYVWNENYVAVIDGATPKGALLWDGLRGDVYVSQLAAKTIREMDPAFAPREAIEYINQAVRAAYDAHGVDFASLPPEERLQCSLLIYSRRRQEIWSFGDCMLRINQRNFRFQKEGDLLFAALRAFAIQIERDRRGPSVDEAALSAYGREQILPYLKAYVSLANRNVPFGYDVIDGGKVFPEHVQVYSVQEGDSVVMASDGYPKLFDTLEETEAYLQQALQKDPSCIGALRGTKGVSEGNVSYDDRTYVSFKVM